MIPGFWNIRTSNSDQKSRCLYETLRNHLACILTLHISTKSFGGKWGLLLVCKRGILLVCTMRRSLHVIVSILVRFFYWDMFFYLSWGQISWKTWNNNRVIQLLGSLLFLEMAHTWPLCYNIKFFERKISCNCSNMMSSNWTIHIQEVNELGYVYTKNENVTFHCTRKKWKHSVLNSSRNNRVTKK